MIIEPIAIRLSEWLTRSSEEQHNTYVIAHAIASLLTNISVILLSITASIFLDTFKETLFTLVALILLRKLTGGHHMPTLEACITFTTLIAIILPFVPDLPLFFHVICSILFLLVVIVNSKKFQFPRISSTSLWRYGILVLLCLLNILGKSEILTALFVIQTCFLIKRPTQHRR